ncbi:hypothetical protein QE152_g35995 [Popillia japonica]|uniref:Uncharacterized protein n=1 Tax=Popillia japonica TaxID=7064 RepID=A0AAW1IE79_POPJA
MSNTGAVMQKTLLGWIISGAIADKVVSTSCNLSIDQGLDLKLSKFWDIEEVTSSQNNYTAEEKACEKHFIENYRRNEDGRFIVKLPLKENRQLSLGNSRDLAVKRFYALERKLCQQPTLKTQYTEFINEYVELGHMQRIHETKLHNADTNKSFYFPHHAVIKERGNCANSPP